MAAYIQGGRNALRKFITGTNNLTSSDGSLNPLFYACQGVRFRKLDVILTTNVDKLGKAGQTVKVAPGHFRNHLMPKLLAVPNIDKFAYLISEQRKIYQHEDEEEEVKVVEVAKKDLTAYYEKAANRLDSRQLNIRVGVDTKKLRARIKKDEPVEIRNPVTAEFIVKEVARQFDVQIEPENLHLPSPLTTFGEYEVPLRLPKSIKLPDGKFQWTLKVKIRGK